MTNDQHILICDPNAAVRVILAEHLHDAGFAVRQAASTAEMLPVVLGGGVAVDLLLLGHAAVSDDACTAIANLRRRGAGLPIILMSPSPQEDHVIAALDAGADDVVARPPRPRELVARIRAQLRSVVPRDDGDLRIGPAVFQPGNRTLSLPQTARPIKLTEKESALLLRLLRSEGRPVSRQTLLREVWGYSPDVTSHTVETHIYRLRRKIEPTPNGPLMLVNESGGYRLCVADSVAVRAEPAAPGWVAPLRRPPAPPVPLYRAG